MPQASFNRKSLIFVVLAGGSTLILVLLPFIETILNGWLLAELEIAITPEGKAARLDGSETGMLTATTIELIVNLFHILKVLLWMTLIVAVVRYISFLVFHTALRNASQNEISSLVRTVLSIIIYIVAFFIIFQSQYPNVQLAPLFTGSTILGIVVGLALQDTLGNLFAGIALQADQPFQVGDVVSITNQGTGVVESVSWRGVKMRTFQNKLMVISNSVLGRETIEVAPKDNLNARIVTFNTLYSNSPSKTSQVVREAVRQVENVSSKKRPIVRIRDLADSGIDWEVKYWCDDYQRHNETDALIRQRIWYVFAREKIDFAFPTRTIHIEEKPADVTAEEYVDATADYLSHVPFFEPLSEEELDAVARASTRRIYAPGEAIVRKGQQGGSMFVLMRGSVKVQLEVSDDMHHTINQLRANDFFGEMSLLTGQPRSATVVVEEEAEVLEIGKRALKPIFESNPQLMESVSEIIDERRKLLEHKPAGKGESVPGVQDKSVISALRKFFGLR